jgi:beta-lactamase class A
MDIKKIQAVIDGYAAKVTDGLGVYFKDLKTGEVACHNADVSYPTASVLKIYILADLTRKIQAGELKWTDRFELKEAFKSVGSGVFQCLDDGLMPTLKDYATLMMIISDNTATDFLFGLTGRDSIKKNVLDPLGLTKTQIDFGCAGLLGLYFGAPIDLPYQEQLKAIKEKGFGSDDFWNFAPYKCETEINDITSAKDAATMFETYYKGEWVNAQASKDALDIMLQCQTNSRIPKYLHGVPVAHKTGTCDRVANDCGIVYSKKGDYILCLFYDGNIDSKEAYMANAGGYKGDAMLANISKDIYDAYME